MKTLPGTPRLWSGQLEVPAVGHMSDFYNDPVHSVLDLRAKVGGTGYMDVNKRVLASGMVVYYAKTHLDLNEKAQSKVGGNFDDAKQCAINLATYLKEHPPVPKVPGKKVIPSQRPFQSIPIPVQPISKRWCESHVLTEEEGQGGRGGGVRDRATRVGC